MRVNFVPTEKPEVVSPVSNTLVVTGSELVVVVVVDVEFVNRGVDNGIKSWGYETPTKTFGQGEIKIGVVVAVGEGGVKYWKKSSVIGVEVGIKKVTSWFIVIGSETVGRKDTPISYVSRWSCSGLQTLEIVWDSESSLSLGEGVRGLWPTFFFFFGAWAGSEAPTLAFHFPPFLSLPAS